MKMLSLLALLSLLLAACGAQQPTPPTAAAEPAADAAPTATPAPFVIVTLPAGDPADLLANLPAPDQISLASATEDPDVGLLFDEISLAVFGGEPGMARISLIVRQDGTFDRNGTTGIVSPQRVEAIDALLDEVNFFGLNANFISLAETTNRRYELTVTRGQRSRTIQSEDGFMPVEYRVLLAEILSVGIVP